MHIINLSINDIHFQILTNSEEITGRLKRDFSYFLSNEQYNYQFKITIHLGVIPWEILPKKRALKRTDTSIIYEKNNIRYNDYHGNALTRVNSITHESDIYAQNLHLAHELGYLLILSQSGKKMDLNGLHKIHAMGVQINSKCVVMIAPSKGGKSTLFMRLMANPDSRIISDDTPVIDSHGNVHAFPQRLGLEEGSTIPPFINRDSIYLLNRRKFGTKVLIPIDALGRSIAKPEESERIILIASKRTQRPIPQITPVSSFRMIPYIFIYMVIGVGLPMILEYFLESGVNDFFKRVKIILSRSKAGLMFLIKSENYFFEMSEDIDANETALVQFIKSN